MIRFQKDPKIRKSTGKFKKNMKTSGIEVVKLIGKDKTANQIIFGCIRKGSCKID